jgi:hypothetical protein
MARLKKRAAKGAPHRYSHPVRLSRIAIKETPPYRDDPILEKGQPPAAPYHEVDLTAGLDESERKALQQQALLLLGNLCAHKLADMAPPALDNTPPDKPDQILQIHVGDTHSRTKGTTDDIERETKPLRTRKRTTAPESKAKTQEKIESKKQIALQEPKAKTEEPQTRQWSDIVLRCLLVMASMTAISCGVASRMYTNWLIASAIGAFVLAIIGWRASRGNLDAQSKARGGERTCLLFSLLIFLIVFAVMASQRENLSTLDQEDLNASVRDVGFQMDPDTGNAHAPSKSGNQKEIAPSKGKQCPIGQIKNPQKDTMRKGLRKTRKGFCKRRPSKPSRVESKKGTDTKAHLPESTSGVDQGGDPPGSGGSRDREAPGQGEEKNGEQSVSKILWFFGTCFAIVIVKGILFLIPWIPVLFSAMLTIGSYTVAYLGYVLYGIFSAITGTYVYLSKHVAKVFEKKDLISTKKINKGESWERIAANYEQVRTVETLKRAVKMEKLKKRGISLFFSQAKTIALKDKK